MIHMFGKWSVKCVRSYFEVLRLYFCPLISVCISIGISTHMWEQYSAYNLAFVVNCAHICARKCAPEVRSYFAQIRSYVIRIRSYTYVVTYVSICASYVWAHPWEMQAQLAQLCGNAPWNVLKCYLNCQPYVTHMLGRCQWRSYIYEVTPVR